MLNFVTYKWKAPPGYRSEFTGEHVDILRRMIRRNYSAPHKLICVTDDWHGILEPDVEIIPLWKDFSDIPNPNGAHNPSCYRRLKMFHRDAGSWLGARACAIDLDTVIVGDITAMLDRPEDIVLWGDTNPTTHYNGGFILFTPGCRPGLWHDFRPETSIEEAKRAKQFGSDQAWISYKLGPSEAKFGKADGIYSYRNDIARQGGKLPDGARVVSFHGHIDPWSGRAQGIEWVRACYR